MIDRERTSIEIAQDIPHLTGFSSATCFFEQTENLVSAAQTAVTQLRNDWQHRGRHASGNLVFSSDPTSIT